MGRKHYLGRTQEINICDKYAWVLYQRRQRPQNWEWKTRQAENSKLRLICYATHLQQRHSKAASLHRPWSLQPNPCLVDHQHKWQPLPHACLPSVSTTNTNILQCSSHTQWAWGAHTDTSTASHSWCLHRVWWLFPGGLEGQVPLRRSCTTFLVEMSSQGEEAIPNLKQYSQKIRIENRMSNMECNQSWWKHLQLCNLNYLGIFGWEVMLHKERNWRDDLKSFFFSFHQSIGETFLSWLGPLLQPRTSGGIM